MDEHKRHLKNRCRVCGCKPRGYTHSKHSDACRALLLATLAIDVTEEAEELYPISVCNKCYSSMKRIEESNDSGVILKSSLSVTTWLPHSEEGCSVCETVITGRPKKRKLSGRPRDDDIDHLSRETIRAVNDIHTLSLYDSPLPTAHFLPTHTFSWLLCQHCKCIPDRPIEVLPCHHLLCVSCIKQVTQQQQLTCACSTVPVTVTKPHPVVLDLLQNLLLSCPKCSEIVSLGNLQSHIGANCPPTGMLPLSQLSVQQLVDAPSGSSLQQHVLGMLAEKFVPSHGPITCRSSSGKPFSLVRITTPRVDSSSASARTLKRRSGEMEQVRDIISKGASTEQFQYEVKTLSKEDRQALLDQAKIARSTAVVSPNDVLALKADLCIPWNKLRFLRRWMGGWNIQLSSEKKMRSLAHELVGPNLTSEMVAFTFPLTGGGEEVRKAPMAYVPDLSAKVQQLLDQNDRVGRLNTGGISIPPGEVWVKLGGDKGGGSMKANFQILNVPHPNSVSNTCVFVAYEGPDSKTNLYVALARYKSQVEELQKLIWKNSKGEEFSVKVLLSGDYEFLCHMYGLSGASGKYCCLWCLIPHNQLKQPRRVRKRFPDRNLANITGDHQSFVAAGSNLADAKHHNNCITEHFFDIPIDHVCLPALHITLGIFFRLFTLLEDECHKLDLELAKSESTMPSESDKQPFKNFTVMIQKERELLDERSNLEEQVKWLDQTLSLLLLTPSSSNIPAQAVAKAIEGRKKQMAVIDTELTSLAKRKPFKKTEGPFVQALDAALASFNVCRQAYYGGTFVGNHVHRTLKEVNTKTLCESVVQTATSRCPSLKHKAEFVCMTFEKVFNLFAQCRDIYDSGKDLIDTDTEELEIRIDKFLDFYRDSFPSASITPKLHMLEDHMVPFLMKMKKGMGFLGEQGAESIHARFNSISRSYVNMRSPAERLECIMKEHFNQVCPDNAARVPQPRKKAKKGEKSTQ